MVFVFCAVFLRSRPGFDIKNIENQSIKNESP